MALVLCMETATERCSIVVASEGNIIEKVYSSGDFDHTAQLTLLIEKCLRLGNLQLSDLDAIAISIGPGSYTSLRAGLSTAKGLAYGLDLPLLPIDSLSIIAAGAIQEHSPSKATLYVPMIDARRMEVYTAIYSPTGETLEMANAAILTPDSFCTYFEQEISLVFAGNGAPKFSLIASSPFAIFSSVRSDATYMPALAEKAYQQKAFADVAYIEPFYLKPPNITVPKKQI
ncbi:universal protein YeaZ [Haliscomenobacter hydrossis DSM 1100]|uniref:Universal protein YeaZ n=2 Tax=Haliscomenobacter TaxID=2349 RepID=F4KPC2_HALH1|nr:universal protein YeaZ [Haliscomenobacter hydrossis DSM 1100]